MLTKVDIKNRRGNVLTLNMEEDNSGYQVADIDGLDPVDANLVSTSYANADGEQFQSAKRGPRNIQFKLDLDPDFDLNTYTTLRKGLYTYFMPKSQVDLRFYTSTGLYVDITGHVEDFKSPRFEQDPQVNISVMCFKPDFIDPRIIKIEGGSVSTTVPLEINYPGPGTVETGTVITLNLNRDLEEFSIYNMSQAGDLSQLDFTGDLLDGDQLVISSLRGNKGITLTRAGVSSSYLYGRTPQSGWIQLSEGINEFRVYAEGDPIPYELEYAVRYGAL
jgi:hypothetical protein